MQQSNRLNGKQQQEQLKLKQESDRFLQLCYNVFEHDAQGRELLDIFKESLLMKAPVADPNKDSNHAYFREGQNHVIRSIMTNIEQHKKNQEG